MFFLVVVAEVGEDPTVELNGLGLYPAKSIAFFPFLLSSENDLKFWPCLDTNEL